MYILYKDLPKGFVQLYRMDPRAKPSNLLILSKSDGISCYQEVQIKRLIKMAFYESNSSIKIATLNFMEQIIMAFLSVQILIKLNSIIQRKFQLQEPLIGSKTGIFLIL